MPGIFGAEAAAGAHPSMSAVAGLSAVEWYIQAVQQPDVRGARYTALGVDLREAKGVIRGFTCAPGSRELSVRRLCRLGRREQPNRPLPAGRDGERDGAIGSERFEP